MRTVQVDLSSDSINVIKFFGGYQGEHNATLLKIKLPARMLNANRDPSDQIDQYRFDFGVSTGANVQGAAIAAGDVTGDTVENYLPQGVMFAPVLSVCVCAYKYDASDPPKPELVEKSSAVDLLIKNPVAGDEDATIIDPFGPGPGATVDQELDPDSTNPIANKPVAEAFENLPIQKGVAPSSAQNSLSTAGCLGFYFRNTSVVGTTFTATLVDKDGNDASLPAKGDLNGDGSVNVYDVYYFQDFLSNPSEHPLKQAADFTGWDSEENDFTYDEDTQSYGIRDWHIDEHDVEYLGGAMNDPVTFPIVDPIVSCKAGYSWNFCGKITNMSGSVITVTIDSAVPSGWDPSAHEYNASDLENSGYIWLPFGPQAGSVPIGVGSTSFGVNNAANEEGSVVAGKNNITDGKYSSVFGRENIAGYCAHAEGMQNKATEFYSHAEGAYNEASGNSSHAEGRGTIASGGSSHAEGRSISSSGTVIATEASGIASHAEGTGTLAAGESSHSEGKRNTVYGIASHVEGQLNTIGAANNPRNNCHAEGYSNTITNGAAVHIEGANNTVSGNRGHAEGDSNTVSGECGHAEGKWNKSSGAYQHVQGKYNYELGNDYADIVGWGTADNARKNIFVLKNDGTLYLAGRVFVSAETANGISGSTRLPTVLSGGSDPTSAIGSFGDFYINTSSHQAFIRVSDSGTWKQITT